MPPDNWLINVCMNGALTLVMLLWSGYHRKLSVLFPLLGFLYFFLRYSIGFWILTYTVLADSAVCLFVMGVEGYFGVNVGG